MAEDRIFHWIASAIAAAGAILLLWAFFGDRARGRRRCPRCWYDMRGVTGLTCSECGREASNERSLHRTRRRWRGAMTAGALVGVAGVFWFVPDVRANRWAAHAPTTALVLAATNPRTSESIRRPAIEELERRRTRDGLSDRHAGALAMAWAHDALTTAPQWPEGADVIARFSISPWYLHPENDRFAIATPRDLEGQKIHVFALRNPGYHVRGGHPSPWRPWKTTGRLPPLPPGDSEVVYDVVVFELRHPDGDPMNPGDRRVIWQGAHTLGVHVRGSVDDMLTPVRDPVMDRGLADHLRPTANVWEDTISISISFARTEVLRAFARHGANLAVPLRADLLHDGNLVSHGHMHWEFHMFYFESIERFGTIGCGLGFSAGCRITGLDFTSLPDIYDGRWSVRLRGDPSMAVFHHLGSAFWDGEIEIPLRIFPPLDLTAMKQRATHPD